MVLGVGFDCCSFGSQALSNIGIRSEVLVGALSEDLPDPLEELGVGSKGSPHQFLHLGER